MSSQSIMSTIASSSSSIPDRSSIRTNGAQTGGSFMGLPAELRVMIYEQMFTPDKFDVYAIEDTLHKVQEPHHSAGNYVGILATCRTICAEATAVLYHNTEFCIHIKDCYWLHFMDKGIYEQIYHRDWNQKPRQRQWISQNPWLQDPRSVVSINNVRNLSLHVEVNGRPAARREMWTPLLKRALLSAANIRSLHITLKAARLFLDQDHIDHTLAVIGQTVQCRGVVTAEMDPWLGASDYIPSSYYRMLAFYGGVDRTNDAIEEAMRRWKESHDSIILRIGKTTASLDSTERRANDLLSETDRGMKWHMLRVREFEKRGRLLGRLTHLHRKELRAERKFAELVTQQETLNARFQEYLREAEETRG